MSENKENIRELLHSQYKQGQKAVLATLNINTIFDQDVVSKRIKKQRKMEKK
jgi:hypothetical protein